MLHGTPFALFRRLLTALLVGALAFGALVALESPASAATARKLTVKASTTGAAVSTSVTISGTLSKSPKGSAVTIQRKSGKKWVTAKKTKTTSAAGTFAGKVKLPSKMGTYQFRAVAAAKGKLKKATSKSVKVRALGRITAKIAASPTRLKAGANTQVTGSAKPFVRGTRVTIQKFVGGRYVSTGVTATLSGTGRFSVPLQIKDNSVLRLSVPRAGTYAPGVSAPAVVVADPVISTPSLPDAFQNTPYNAQLTQVGTGAGTWAVTPTLPAGLTLSTSTGRITGTPPALTAEKPYTFTFAQRGQTTASKVLTLEVTTTPPPTIATATLKTGQKGSSYSTTLVAVNSPAGNWSTTALPPGLTLVPSTGVISGIPTAVGTTPVTINFTQTSTGKIATPKTLDLEITPAPGPSIRTTSLPNGLAGGTYETFLEASNGATGTWSQVSGSLPPLYQLVPSTGRIFGNTSLVVTQTTTYSFTIGFTNADGTATPVPLSITIVGPGGSVNKVQASAGGSNTCRIQDDKTLWCWGADDAGQLGDGGLLGVDPPGQLTPKQIGTATDWTAISFSDDNLPNEAHVCGLRGTAAYCWGSDAHGMLGDGAGVAGSQTSPSAVTGGLGWSTISSGWTHTCGVTTTRALYCWGDNTFGQLGTGTGDQAAPAQVGSDTDWESVSGGYTSSCAVKTNGSLFCWGSNSRGQLGIGSTDSQVAPTRVGTGSWTSVSVGPGFACARAVSGAIFCWGPSSNGQLGNGVNANSSATDVKSPLQVGSATGWTSVTTGDSHVCATNTAGELWCWGANSSSQLGDNSTTTRTTPTKIGTDTDWQSVSAGNSHSCGVRTNGDVWCWGANTKGKVGVGSAVATVATPTKVS